MKEKIYNRDFECDCFSSLFVTWLIFKQVLLSFLFRLSYFLLVLLEMSTESYERKQQNHDFF